MMSRPLPTPKAVLFDLFQTLVSVPPPKISGEIPVSDILGVSGSEWRRLYYDEDVFGRALGRVQDAWEAMRLVTHHIDPTVSEQKITAATESRRRRFQMGLADVESGILQALDRLREAGIRTALVSDAGADDVEHWHESPLRQRFDATIFSYRIGIRKPDPRIYRHALAEIGVRAEDAIFVGDGGSNEHWGARNVGMPAVLVTRLASQWFPEMIEGRRAHADWEFEDVPAFVDALGLTHVRAITSGKQ
jgi:putative hydrolase of the HAD superfamily